VCGFRVDRLSIPQFPYHPSRSKLRGIGPNGANIRKRIMNPKVRLPPFFGTIKLPHFVPPDPPASGPQLFASSLNPTRTRLHRLAPAQSKRWESTWCLTIKRATAVFPVAHQYRLSFPPLPQSAAFPISELRNVSCVIPMQFYAILMLYSFPACPILSRKSLSRVRPQHVVISSPLPSLPLRVLS